MLLRSGRGPVREVDVSVDVQKLLAEVSAEAPCGDDLEYDPGFQEMERLAQGQPERQMGATVVPAEPPDWRGVRTKALELLARTRDLRIALQLVRAELALDGLAGFADGLVLLRGLIERFWADVHPRLDPDDNNDPTLRVNVLATLVDAAVIAQVREAALARSRTLGVATLRDHLIHTGAMSGAAVLATDVYDAVFLDCDIEVLQAAAQGARVGFDAVTGLEQSLTSAVGAGRAVDFSPLRVLLRQAGQLLDDRLARRGVVAAPATDETAAAAAVEAGGEEPAAGSGRGGGGVPGRINNRDEVIRALDAVCEYYQRCEPSSPVPILLVRARRLAAMGFLDIMRNLAPDSLPAFDVLRGPEDGAGG